MKISKRVLKILIENYLTEDDSFDLGPEPDLPDIDLSPAPKSEKVKSIENMAKFKASGVKQFIEEFQKDINKNIKAVGTSVKEYFKSSKFKKTLESKEYKNTLSAQNITQEKFISDIEDQIQSSQVQLVKSFRDKETLGFLDYGNIDLKLHQKSKKVLNFLSDAALPYGERFKSKPVVYIFIENIFQSIAADKNEAFWFRLKKEDIFPEAYKRILNVLKHEFLHIGNMHQVDLLGSNKNDNPIFEKIGKYFLKESELFLNEKRNIQTNASNKSGKPNEPRRKDILSTLKDYLNIKSSSGTIEIMERIQKLKMKNNLLTAMQEWEQFKIDYSSEKYEKEILDMFCIINWEKFDSKEIAQNFETIAIASKSVSNNIA